MRVPILLALTLVASAGCGAGQAGQSGGGDGGGTMIPSSDGGTLHAGSINTACAGALPAGATPADTAHPTATVGSGSAASCTFAALESAVATGGVITFDCGPDLVTLSVASTLTL